jgi:hypothetical protein
VCIVTVSEEDLPWGDGDEACVSSGDTCACIEATCNCDTIH